MNWIYQISANWHETGTTTYAKTYFRPTMTDENGDLLAGNMVIMQILAVDILFQTPEQIAKNSPEINEIYFNQLAEKDFYFKTEDRPEGHEDYLQMTSTLFLKMMFLTKDDVEYWIKTFLQIQGIPCDVLSVATYNEFADENPVMRMFGKAAKAGEEKFGKDWWKKDEDK
jgi:hypothetical protein